MHVFVRVLGGIPANPQFTLARAPGAEIERGRLSGKVDPDATHPSGPGGRRRRSRSRSDDGPSPATRRILTVLKRLHVRATFFVVGRLAERYPKLVRRELAPGMGVGSHSYSHPYPPALRAAAARGDPRGDRTCERGSYVALASAFALPAAGRLVLAKNVVQDENIIVGVLAVPASSAQRAADELVDVGVKIIFNYSEALLDVPNDIRVLTSKPSSRTDRRPLPAGRLITE